MLDKKLSQALENLVSRGDLSQEDANKVEVEFNKTTAEDSSKRRILSEVGGYLGGLFILVALLILVGQQWKHLSRIAQFSLFLIVAILVFVASFITGKSTKSRARLAGLLGLVSAICATLSILIFRDNAQGLVPIAMLIGWLISLTAFILYRAHVGELSVAGYSIALGISGAEYFFPHFHNNPYLSALVLLAVGSTWLYLATTPFFHRGLGDAIAMATLFISGQLFFGGDLRFLAYLMDIAIAVTASWIFSKAPEWPLLVGGIAAITVGTGEFVGNTLGGSLGAALGLLTSGIVFVTGSIYSFKRSKRDTTKTITKL